MVKPVEARETRKPLQARATSQNELLELPLGKPWVADRGHDRRGVLLRQPIKVLDP